jgi:ABC-type spermidine/putrescine transport system permease subunit II
MTDETGNSIKETLQTTQQRLTASQENQTSSKKYLIISIFVIIIILTLIVLATIFLVNPENSQTTEQIRDVVIIFMALESLVMGIALVILIVQLSTLINLLQNEIRPIINSTSETVNTLKGTAKFLSDNLSEPVIKLNQMMAMIKKIFSIGNR